jgi:hypothetical protein
MSSLSPRKSSSRRTPPKSTSQTLASLAPSTAAELATPAQSMRFWGWAVFTFLVVAGLLVLALSLTNPSLVQELNTMGQPTGQTDWGKVAGAGIVAGVVGLTIYVLVVLGRARSIPVPK